MEEAHGLGTNTNMNKLTSILLVILSSLLGGCTQRVDVEVFNNTGKTILLSNQSETKTIPHGSSAKVEFHYEIEIKSELGIWIYQRKVPVKIDSPEFFDGTLRIQVDADGIAYALPTESNPPLTKFENQPNDFPLKPIQKGKQVDQSAH